MEITFINDYAFRIQCDDGTVFEDCLASIPYTRGILSFVGPNGYIVVPIEKMLIARKLYFFRKQLQQILQD